MATAKRVTAIGTIPIDSTAQIRARLRQARQNDINALTDRKRVRAELANTILDAHETHGLSYVQIARVLGFKSPMAAHKIAMTTKEKP